MTLRQRRAVLAVVAPLIFGLVSLAFGRDSNWDLRNYHWYNPYAVLTDRYQIDIAPAGLQSFLTPLLDIPWFVLGNALPAPVVGFLLGAFQSLNLILLYYLAFLLLPFDEPRQRNSVAMWVAIAGMCGGGSLGLLGTTFHDNVVSIGVLGSVLAVLANRQALANGSAAPAARRAAVAAIPIGLAVAGKLTAAPYAIGLTAAFLFLPAPMQRRIWLLLSFGAGLFCVVAVVLGPWLLHLWQTTGSPFFPYLPGSRFAATQNFPFTHFLPGDWFEALVYPFVFSLDPLRVGENEFRDYRIAAAYLVVPLCLIAGWCWRRGPTARSVPDSTAYLAAAISIAYGVWLAAFAIYRYAVTLEMLAPLVIAVAIAALPLPARTRAIATKVLLIALLVTALPPDWGRARWTKGFIEVNAPAIERPETTLVLLLDKPLAYIVPAFPPQVGFIQLVPELAPLHQRQAAWNVMVRARLNGHRGDLYGVRRGSKDLFKPSADVRANAHTLLSAYALQLDEASCRPLPTNLDQAESLVFCDVFDLFGLRLDDARCHPAPPGPEISAEFCKVIRR